MRPTDSHQSLTPGLVGPGRIYQRHEVFVVGGQPTVTYNARPIQDANQRLRDYLDERGRILCITGPTKSGKTVLARQALPHAVRVSGGALASIDDFWEDIVDKLVVYTDESAERTTVQSGGVDLAVDAGLKVGGTGVGFKAGTSSQDTLTLRHTESRSRGHRQVARAELVKHRPALIVDDFHHIEPEMQRAIVRGVKDLVFERVPIVFVAVPHHAADIVRAEPEMGGRVEQVEITPWLLSELEEIAIKGFSALNISCPQDISARMARESYGSPHLMQNFCLQICKANAVEETLPAGLGLMGELNEGFFRHVAATEGQSETYRRLAQGPRQRTDRLGRRLRDGAVVDIYTAVLRAIAHTGPRMVLDWTEIRAALREVLADEPPRRSEYTRVLEKMSAIALDMVWDVKYERAVADPVLEFDSSGGQLYISDPFFAYHLRWAIRPGPAAGLSTLVGIPQL